MEILLVIALLIYVAGLRGRVKELEQKVSGQTTTNTPQASTSVEPQAQNQGPATVSETGQPIAPLPPTEPPSELRFIAWVKEDFLVKLVRN